MSCVLIDSVNMWMMYHSVMATLGGEDRNETQTNTLVASIIEIFWHCG